MTAMEMIDHVRKKLSEQGEPSSHKDDLGRIRHRYVGRGGKRCAIGWISDRVDLTPHEGRNVGALLADLSMRDKREIMPEDLFEQQGDVVYFLEILQECHDYVAEDILAGRVDPSEFVPIVEEQLDKLAHRLRKGEFACWRGK